MPFGYSRQQAVFKPVFKELPAGRMFAAFNGKTPPAAQRAKDIFTPGPRLSFDIFDFPPLRGAGVFPLQTGVYAASASIKALFMRNPLYLGRKFRASLF
jgi:hypothetical protein